MLDIEDIACSNVENFIDRANQIYLKDIPLKVVSWTINKMYFLRRVELDVGLLTNNELWNMASHCHQISDI